MIPSHLVNSFVTSNVDEVTALTFREVRNVDGSKLFSSICLVSSCSSNNCVWCNRVEKKREKKRGERGERGGEKIC